MAYFARCKEPSEIVKSARKNVAKDWDTLQALMIAPKEPKKASSPKSKIRPVCFDTRYTEGSTRRINPRLHTKEVSPKSSTCTQEQSAKAYLDSCTSRRANRTRVEENERLVRRLIHGFKVGQEDIHVATLDLSGCYDRCHGNWSPRDALNSQKASESVRLKSVFRDQKANKDMNKLLWYPNSDVSNNTSCRKSLRYKGRNDRKYGEVANFVQLGMQASRESQLLRQKILEREKNKTGAGGAMFPSDGYGSPVKDKKPIKLRERDIPLW